MKKRKYQVIAAIFMVLLMSFWASDFLGAEEERTFDAQTRGKMENALDKAMEKSRSRQLSRPSGPPAREPGLQ